MIKKIIKKIKIFSIILKLSEKESNDYSFGYKVRKIINLYKEGKEVNKKEIFKEKIKP
jgi:hypothetical protein